MDHISSGSEAVDTINNGHHNSPEDAQNNDDQIQDAHSLSDEDGEQEEDADFDPEDPTSIRYPRATDLNQGTMLLQAASIGKTNLVSALLSLGLNPLLVDNKGHNRSALYEAVSSSHISVVSLLLNAKGGGRKLLLQRAYAQDETALHRAASVGNVEVLKLLLEYACEVDVEARQKQGLTPLMLASSRGHESCVEILLEHGAQVYVRREQGGTPLHGAAFSGYAGILRMLIRAGSRQAGWEECLEKKNVWGDTALFRAVEMKQLECVRLLVEVGASLHVSDNKGRSLLHLAADRDLVDFLLDYLHCFSGDEINGHDERGNTPLRIARERGSTQSADVLELNGGKLSRWEGYSRVS